MSSIPRALVVAALFSCIATLAHAQQSEPAGRYTMHKTEDGFIRLDTQTGAISVCRKRDASWSCTLALDESRKLEEEIAALRSENKLLSDEIRTLKDSPTGRRGDDDDERYADRGGPPAPVERPSFRLPSEKEVDKALDYFETMLKKFQERLKRLERGEPKGEKDGKAL